MENSDNFDQKINKLKKQVHILRDDIPEETIRATAERLEGLNFSPSIITSIPTFLRLNRQTLLDEIDRILALPDQEACALAPDDSRKCEDLRIQFITVLIFYYEKLLLLRQGNAEEWDEVDELYVHD